jgi:hypothetical protein
MAGKTIEDLEALVEYLKGEVERLEEENARLSAIAAEPLRKAEEVLVAHGRSLSHNEIRKVLADAQLPEPIIEHVVSQVVHVLKKVKKGSVLSWAAEEVKRP